VANKAHPKDAPPIRPTPKARATRARLIETAAEAFVDEGYGAISVRDLAQRTEMTSGAIYGHFTSKANLLGEAVSWRIEEDLEARGRRSYDDTNLADWLAHNFRDYRTRRALRALILEGAAAARVDEDVRRMLRGVLIAKLDEWAALYRQQWDQEGLDRDVDPEGMMQLLVATELGLGVLEALDIDPPKPRVMSTIIGKLIGSLRASRRERRTA
jgi:AcrR family transcriptional regulator